MKFGLFLVPLTPELRAKYERNAGALVDIVMEDSPAFTANVLPGDVLTEIDGKAVESNIQATALLRETQPASGVSSLKVLRNGTEKTLTVRLAPN